MYNPLKILDDAFRKNGAEEKYRRRRLHPVFDWYELFAFLSFIPGIFVFLNSRGIAVAFLLSAASVFACSEIEKKRYLNSAALLIVFNLIPALCALIYIILIEPSVTSMLAFALYGLLAAWGFYARHKQIAIGEEHV